MKQLHQSLEEGWRNNKRAGFIRKELDKEVIDREGSVEWIRHRAMKYDNERVIMAAQDNA